MLTVNSYGPMEHLVCKNLNFLKFILCYVSCNVIVDIFITEKALPVSFNAKPCSAIMSPIPSDFMQVLLNSICALASITSKIFFISTLSRAHAFTLWPFVSLYSFKPDEFCMQANRISFQ